MHRYSERALLLLLAAVQFTHILDFMVMMPLGQQLMRELSISPAEFSHLVAAYTISAGVVGFLAAPFMDRFDRRKVLLITYAGFFLGTLACALSHTANQLLAARAVCGRTLPSRRLAARVDPNRDARTQHARGMSGPPIRSDATFPSAGRVKAGLPRSHATTRIG